METVYTSAVIPLSQWLLFDSLGGPRPFPARHMINLQKGGTLVFVLTLMVYYDNWSWTAHVYLANHGVYGLIWLLKDMTVPDTVWMKHPTILSQAIIYAALGLYWAAGYIVVAHRVDASPSLATLCIMMNTLGSVLMIATDTQKYFTLKFKKGLISDGWLTWSRNTNYLGEMMIYLSFALLANHWAPYTWLALIWSILFMSNMVAKDISLRKKEGGPEYVQKAGFLLPNIIGWAVNFNAPPPKAAKAS
ncbi:Aste57867_5848 [Aphanomyces stellatus]|uniref:Aste57867_5848 protein n=1 Tax=Aphanomyces stellatus TaxID=120398 RepID=A0A485KH95_9STRA|nr:hypothetical protein As57867_005834 [Aphanomyces stellatus]VFT82871.1 Aste57867_5848 [Aphanomyces stellatus]